MFTELYLPDCSIRNLFIYRPIHNPYYKWPNEKLRSNDSTSILFHESHVLVRRRAKWFEPLRLFQKIVLHHFLCLNYRTRAFGACPRPGQMMCWAALYTDTLTSQRSQLCIAVSSSNKGGVGNLKISIGWRWVHFASASGSWQKSQGSLDGLAALWGHSASVPG